MIETSNSGTDKKPHIITPANIDVIALLNGQKGIFVGQNGSGKSFLAKAILAHDDHKDILIIDPKCEIFARGAKYLKSPDEVYKNWGGLMIYQPKLQFDKPSSYNDVFQVAYYKKNNLVFIDELYSVTGKQTDPPDGEVNYLQALYTRGRSLGITVMGCTQRPAWVPQYTLTECQKHYIFRLSLSDDRKKLSGMVGYDVPMLSGHNFLYSDERFGQPIIVKYEGGK